MNIVVDINHPAHVHYFKNFIWKMQEKGHEVLVIASDKDVALSLLNNYNINYINIGNYGASFLKKMLSIPTMDMKFLLSIHGFKPDIFVSFGSIRAAHVAFLMGKPCINFTDTEHSKEQMLLYKPFVTAICTPECFHLKLGHKQIRFNSYLELASLHPKYFTPDPSVLSEIGIEPGKPLINIRFVSWGASHDIGQYGIRDKVALVKELERFGRVMITSEGDLPEVLRPNQMRIPPEKLHDLLFFSTLYIGEGATTASESAVLGTHAVYVNTLSLGYIEEEESKYGLVTDFSKRTITDEQVISKAVQLLSDDGLVRESKMKRARLIADKIDLTAFMVWFVEQFPTSMKSIKDNPNLLDRFKGTDILDQV